MSRGNRLRQVGRDPGEALPGKAGPASCELCLRGVEGYTIHHLVPKARGGKFGPTARLCATCHRQLHAMFSESTLAAELHSLELLKANPQVRGYLKWARRQKDGANFRVRRARERR